MLQYILRRVLWMIPTLLGILLIILGLLHAAPGDPATQILGLGGGAAGEMSGEGGDIEARIAKFERENALDRSFAVQYLGYLGPFNVRPDGHELFGGDGRNPYGGLLALDFGTELFDRNKAIGDEIALRLKQVTLPLALISTFLIYAIAIPIGIFSATRAGTRADRTVTLLLFILYSIPVFWAGLMLQLAFGKGWLALMWPAAFLTSYMLIARIRQVAEHAGTPDLFDLDPRNNTRTTLPRWWEIPLMAPNFVNYHLEHHMAPGVPAYRLRDFHRFLKDRGVYDDTYFPRGYSEVIRGVVHA